jgi:hypothetical protein
MIYIPIAIAALALFRCFTLERRCHRLERRLNRFRSPHGVLRSTRE